MHIFIEKFSRKCDIGCDFETTVGYIVKLSSYIKEQLKFASFLGIEGGGGQNSQQCFFLMLNFKYDSLNKLEHFRTCTQKYNRYIVHFFSENFGGQK